MLHYTGMSNTPPSLPDEALPLWLSVGRMCLRLALIAAFAFGVHKLSSWMMMQTDAPGDLTMAGVGILAVMLAAYALMIAVPFVPGIEIGVALMLIQGSTIAPFVYLATLLGLTLAFLIGLWVPYSTLHRIFLDMRMRSACRLLDRVAPLSPDARLRFLSNKLPSWLAPLATRYRYVTLALLINLPGNGLIGGGGGLAMLAGLTRVYAPRATILTFAIAIAPIPLLVWLTGSPATWFTG